MTTLAARLAELGFKVRGKGVYKNGGWWLREITWTEYRQGRDISGKAYIKYGEPKLRFKQWRLANESTIVHREDTLSAMVNWLEKMAWVGKDNE